MTKIQIRKVNGVPMGRPKNPYPFTHLGAWECFEQSVTEHEAPGFEEGEAEGELIYQVERVKYLGSDRTGDTLIDILSAKATYNKEWVECSKSAVDVFNSQKVIGAFGKFKTRQIWVAPTPEKVEVKENPVIQRLEEVEQTVAELASLVDRLAIAVRKRLEDIY